MFTVVFIALWALAGLLGLAFVILLIVGLVLHRKAVWISGIVCGALAILLFVGTVVGTGLWVQHNFDELKRSIETNQPPSDRLALPAPWIQ